MSDKKGADRHFISFNDEEKGNIVVDGGPQKALDRVAKELGPLSPASKEKGRRFLEGDKDLSRHGTSFSNEDGDRSAEVYPITK